MGYSPRCRKESDMTERLHFFSLSGSIREHGTQCGADTLELECAHEPSRRLVKRKILLQAAWDGA